MVDSKKEPVKKKEIVVESPPVREIDPAPLQEPDKTTIDLEPDATAAPEPETIMPDSATAEIINAVIRNNPIKRAESFINPATGERRVFIYTEGGMILKFIGRFEVTRN